MLYAGQARAAERGGVASTEQPETETL